ncbi:MAG TPA: RNA 2',3'-cyclic phosphodiesterase [Terriglobales bacterium]|nr:RNA 2',3'-cyclic phosphodiesterase [Terriglobales bacterium]
MRVFIGLDIPEAIRSRISQFSEGLRGFAPDARWVGPETFHITLKFIGKQSAQDVERIKDVLRSIKAAPLEVSFRGYGIFPNPKSARVFWVGIHADERLSGLAASVDAATSQLGIPREQNAFLPHLTLARARGASGSPHQRFGGTKSSGGSRSPFARAIERLEGLAEPEFGTMTATEFFLYESKLSPKGAQYAKLERFALNG